MKHHRTRFSIPVILLGALLAGCVDTQVTEEYQAPEYSPAQIRAALLGSDMKAKIEAEAQLADVPEAERLQLLTDVRQQGDDKTRLLVVKQLDLMRQNAQARALLEDIAANDEDMIVQMKAKRVLKTHDEPLPPEEEPAPAPEGDPEAGS